MNSILQLENIIREDWNHSLLSSLGQVIHNDDIVRIEEGKTPGKGRIVKASFFGALDSITAKVASFFCWNTNTFDLVKTHYSIRSMIITAVKDTSVGYTPIEKYMLVKEATESYNNFLETVKAKQLLGHTFVEHYKFNTLDRKELLGWRYDKYKRKKLKITKEELQKMRVHSQALTPEISPSFAKKMNAYTLWHALDNKRIQSEKKEYKNLDQSKITERAIWAGLRSVPQSIIFSLFANCLLEIGDTYEEDELKTTALLAVTVAPIVEETFKAVGQNFIKIVQKSTKKILPPALKNSRIAKWVTSPSCRIVAINSLFGLVHLSNINKLGINGVIVQATNVILFPVTAILYHTTGDVASPIVAHFAHNAALIAMIFAQKYLSE